MSEEEGAKLQFAMEGPSAASILKLASESRCTQQIRPPGTDAAHACLFRPVGQAALCAEQLKATDSWPNASALALARSTFFNMSVLLVGDSTLENKQRVLDLVLHVNSSCKRGPGSCFVSLGRHLTRSPKASPSVRDFERSGLRRDFDVVVFNDGMHYLSPHYPNRTSFSGYLSQLRDCAGMLTSQYPQARLVYMLTNRICISSWRGGFFEQAQLMENRTEDLNFNMQWSDIGVQSVRVAEREVAREQGWVLLDGQTAHHCSCSGLKDGRHFLPLVPNFLVRLTRLVKSMPSRGMSGR